MEFLWALAFWSTVLYTCSKIAAKSQYSTLALADLLHAALAWYNLSEARHLASTPPFHLAYHLLISLNELRSIRKTSFGMFFYCIATFLAVGWHFLIPFLFPDQAALKAFIIETTDDNVGCLTSPFVWSAYSFTNNYLFLAIAGYTGGVWILQHPQQWMQPAIQQCRELTISLPPLNLSAALGLKTDSDLIVTNAGQMVWYFFVATLVSSYICAWFFVPARSLTWLRETWRLVRNMFSSKPAQTDKSKKSD